MSNATQVYADIGIDTEVMAASPHRLIQLLLEKCQQQIQAAKVHITNNDVKQKHRTIASASDVVNYLRLCLNFEEKKSYELAKQLDELYMFLEKSLLQATLQDNADYLDKAGIVLNNLREGWNGIETKV